MGDNVSRLEYMNLINPYCDTDKLKKDIAKAIWNDERLLRQDIKDIANDLLRELEFG